MGWAIPEICPARRAEQREGDGWNRHRIGPPIRFLSVRFSRVAAWLFPPGGRGRRGWRVLVFAAISSLARCGVRSATPIGRPFRCPLLPLSQAPGRGVAEGWPDGVSSLSAMSLSTSRICLSSCAHVCVFFFSSTFLSMRRSSCLLGFWLSEDSDGMISLVLSVSHVIFSHILCSYFL